MYLGANRHHRLLVILCLLAVLLAALTPAASGFLLAFLIPLLLLFAAIFAVPGRIVDECVHLRLLPNLPVFSSLPPPAR